MSENGRIKNVEIGHFYVLFGSHLSFFMEKTPMVTNQKAWKPGSFDFHSILNFIFLFRLPFRTGKIT